MQHNTFPRQFGFTSLDPKTPSLEPDKMSIATEPKPWEASSKLACVNSYGAAGSNAAVAIREAPPVSSTMLKNRATPTGKQPIYLLAASETSLKEPAKELLLFVEAQNSLSFDHVHLLADKLFNLADRSIHDLAYSYTGTVTTVGISGGLAEKHHGGNRDSGQGFRRQLHRSVIMVFPGQEPDILSQEMINGSAQLRFQLDECDGKIRLLGHETLYPAIYERDSIQDMPTLHAALFAAQYATAMTWIDNGLPVSCFAGHSFGQLTALRVSGSLALRDAMRLVVGQAELIERSWGEERGCMMSMLAPYVVVRSILDGVNSMKSSDILEIAFYNHPTNHVVVGTASAISRLERHIAENDTFRHSARVTRLRATHGSRSALTERILPELEKLANFLQWNKLTISVELTTQEAVDREPGAWLITHHTRYAVHFSHAVQGVAQKVPTLRPGGSRPRIFCHVFGEGFP